MEVYSQVTMYPTKFIQITNGQYDVGIAISNGSDLL
jgi:hypothetical protein